jgi:hypothetical protein
MSDEWKVKGPALTFTFDSSLITEETKVLYNLNQWFEGLRSRRKISATNSKKT